MNIKEIQKAISKQVTIFKTGGFRPTNTIKESWIGKVFAYKTDEEIPVDENGELMMPLAQLYLSELSHLSHNIKNVKLLTVFISKNFPECFEPMGENWLIREYETLQDLKIKELSNPQSYIKPFPLKPKFVENDYPLWDGGGLSCEMEIEILKLEKSGEIESYYDIIEHSDYHKIGGYPSFCQSGIDFGEGFEFIFQISSDEKANLNIIDGGSFLFAKNINTNQWKIYYDFY